MINSSNALVPVGLKRSILHACQVRQGAVGESYLYTKWHPYGSLSMTPTLSQAWPHMSIMHHTTANGACPSQREPPTIACIIPTKTTHFCSTTHRITLDGAASFPT
eukprot:1155282-Pelagomonas_calceolata.AAC.8